MLVCVSRRLSQLISRAFGINNQVVVTNMTRRTRSTHTNGLSARTRISSHSSSAAQVITFRYSHVCYKIVARGSRSQRARSIPRVRDWTQLNTIRVKQIDYVTICGGFKLAVTIHASVRPRESHTPRISPQRLPIQPRLTRCASKNTW